MVDNSLVNPDKCSTFLISLPQTAIRLWGIDSKLIGNLKIVEVPVRSQNDHYLTTANQNVNKMIFSELGRTDIEFIPREELQKSHTTSSILDCNILNLAHHYPQLGKMRDVRVLDYSSLGQRSLLASDAANLREFGRAVARNLRFKKKFSPLQIFHWDDYAFSRSFQLINFGWRNDFVNTNNIKEKCSAFMNHNLWTIPELRDIPQESKILIVAPHINSGEDEVINEINSLLTADQNALEAFTNCSYIIIKQHRTSTKKFTSDFKLLGKNCRVLRSDISRAIPVEIYMYGFALTYIFSAPSSAVYSHSSNSILLRNSLNRADLAEYGLMANRYKSYSLFY